MPELFIELFSEEIPARMQARGAADLVRLVSEALAPLRPRDPRSYAGPRRLALGVHVEGGTAEARTTERGPRVSAPEQAVAGFLRKHGVTREALRQEGDFLVLERVAQGIAAADLIAREMPALLRRFPWPKSMRWGTSRFTWVRPLRRIVCLLDGDIVPFTLADEEDAAHGLAAGVVSEGHRFHAPGAFTVTGETQWVAGLRARRVIASQHERRGAIAEAARKAAAAAGGTLVEDEALLDEVAGLVEWPVTLRGRIDPAFMTLPPEVMQVSMRVNQRYFAVRDESGAALPWFVFVANIVADDGGTAIIAGNERVLRARFADARHFWDLDRARTLESRVTDLRAMTFHARLGTQYDRTMRIVRLAETLQPGPDARRAALLCKADLTTGMVGEFPELQGIMGGYYARHDGEPDDVWQAVRDHYAPRGPADPVPTKPAAIAVALADKLDQLMQFFAIGEKPTGSGDPYALRRAALGIIRIVRENGLGLKLLPLLEGSIELRDFIFERLRVQLRAEGARHDILSAILRPDDDDIVLALARMDAVASLIATDAGRDLLTLYRRAANILRAEEAKDGAYQGDYQPALLRAPAEHALHAAFREHHVRIVGDMTRALFRPAMERTALLREPVDRFFNEVTVNDPDPPIRANRLRMLAALRGVMHDVADFSKIEA